jgi:DNA-binding MarR family transcriptional regulator
MGRAGGEARLNESSVQRNYGRLHARHVEALTRHLIACRHVCDGDLDLFLVLTIIGERTFTARNAPEGMSHAEFLQGTVADLQPAAINLQSIADYSGIPRETVRRKVETLIGKGWVRRDSRRFVTVTDKAKDNLGVLTESGVRYLREMESAFQAQRID